MLIKTNKKKAIFSSLKNTKKFNLDLKPQYVQEIIVSDEEIESGENFVTHQLLVKIPVDKVASLENNVKHLEGFVCKDFQSLRTRAGMLSGFSSDDKQSLNYAIFNKETLAREDFKRKIENANLIKVFNLDVALKLFLTLMLETLKTIKKNVLKYLVIKK